MTSCEPDARSDVASDLGLITRRDPGRDDRSDRPAAAAASASREAMHRASRDQLVQRATPASAPPPARSDVSAASRFASAAFAATRSAADFASASTLARRSRIACASADARAAASSIVVDVGDRELDDLTAQQQHDARQDGEQPTPRIRPRSGDGS